MMSNFIHLQTKSHYRISCVLPKTNDIVDKAIEKKLTMYCANPDFETVEKNNNQNIFCMGAIAEIYKKMGGDVIIQGKPEKDIYIETTKSIKLDKSKTIAIGDSIFHDIKGANNFKIDSIGHGMVNFSTNLFCINTNGADV